MPPEPAPPTAELPSANARQSVAPATRCGNCGAEFANQFCSQCGQQRCQNQRLGARELIARFCQHLLDLDSALLRTMIGLTIRPGPLCREYIGGRRKQYMNPVAYFALAGTVSLLLGGVITQVFGDPMAEPAASTAPAEPPASDFSQFADAYATWLLLALLVPLAMTWWQLFRSAGRNLAENYVFALYVLGHFTCFELAALTPLSYFVPEWALSIVYVLVWLAYSVFAGTVFYGEGVLRTTLKMLVSIVILILVVTIAGGLIIVIWPKALGS